MEQLKRHIEDDEGVEEDDEMLATRGWMSLDVM